MSCLYTSGDYASLHPDWHAEDSRQKARWLSATVPAELLDRWRRTGLRVADIGCGAGGVGAELCAVLSALGVRCSVTGYDISPQALSLARRNHPRMRFVQSARPVADRYELAMFVDVLEHLASPERALRAAHEYAGAIAVHLPLEDNVLQRMRPGLPFYTDRYGHLHFYHRRSALQLLARTGWSIASWSWTGGIVDREACPRPTIGTYLRRILFRVAPDLTVRLGGQAGLMLLCLTRRTGPATSAGTQRERHTHHGH